MAADLAVAAWWLALFVGGMFSDDDPTAIPDTDTGLALPATVLALSLAGTWWAVLGRAHHPRTVRAGIAVSVLRLVLLSLVAVLIKAMDSE